MNRKSWRKLCLALLILSTSLVLHAGWDAPLCDRDAVMKAAVTATAAAYPDADTVLLADTESARYNPDGTAEKVDDCYEKILTQKGKEERDSLDFHYTLPYNEVSIEKLEIIRDGKTIVVDIAKQSRTQVESGQMGSNIYNPNSKVTVVQVTDLQPGDILHYVTRRKELKPYIPNTFSEYFVLQGTSPIIDYRIVVDAPASRPLRSIAVKDEVKGTVTSSVTKKGDRVVYEWRARNVPKVFEEPGMPPLFTVVQRLLLSTTPEWKDISQWYWNLCQPHLEKTTPAMIAKTRELIAGLKDDDAKMRAIYYFVAHQIRYMGITTETDAPGYEPHDVNITFDNKYGVCRDKAALLVTMLRIAGFNARPVLFYVGPKKDFEVPNNYFNHAIVGVEKKQGDYILMDPTDENSRDPFPTYLCNKSYLVARPDGDPLRTSAVVPAERNLLRITTTGELGSSGTLKAFSVFNFDGVNDGAYRDAFLRWKAEKREEFFASKLRQTLSGAILRKVEILPVQLDDSSKPMEIRLAYDVPNFLINGNEASMLRLPWLGMQFGMVNFVIDSTGLEQRRFPMQIEATCGVKEKFEIKLDGLSKPLLLPQYAPNDRPDFSWDQKVDWDKNILSGESQFSLRTMEIAPAGYADLKDQLRRMEYDRRKMPLFVADSLTRNADVLVLRDDVNIEVQDENNWTEREIISKKILTYSGKKAASEMKLNYNPVWTDLELVSASVVSPDGKRHQVKTQEINLMDAPWAGSAPRYPAAKIKVVSLPNVEPGSVIEYETKTIYRNRPFFAAYDVFKSHDPVVSQTFQVTIPRKLLEKVQVLPAPAEVSFNVKETADKKIWSWSATGVSKVKEELNQPPLFSFCPAAVISAGEWQSYAETLNRSLTAVAEGQELTKAKARELAAAAGKNSAAQLDAVNKFLLKNIHLAGPDFTRLPLTCLSKADVTLKDGYGNAADRAVVFYAMLKELGFKPEFVVGGGLAPVGSMYQIFSNHPVSWLFDEVMVRVECNGEALYLNADNHYGIPGICRFDGYPALDLVSGKIIRINVPERLKSAVTTEIAMDFDVDGNASITRKTVYSGEEYSSFRKKYSEMTPENRRRFFLEEAATISQAARIVKAGAEINSYPAVKKLTVKAPRYAVRDGRYLYFSMPGAMLRRLLPSGAAERATPYFFDRQTNMRFTIVATVAGVPAKVAMQPISWKWQAPDQSGSVDFTASWAKSNQFVVDSTISLSPAIVPPYRVSEYLWVGDRLGSPSQWQVTVELSPKKPVLPTK